MLCQNCGKAPAVTHYHSVVNGVVDDKYLCAECIGLAKLSHFEDDGIFKMLTSFLSDTEPLKTVAERCECCGTSFAEIRKTGRVGCGNCYKTFSSQLNSTLQRLHKSTAHIGKRPEKADKTEQSNDLKTDKINKLQEELKKAIEDENYERAAQIRDIIRKKEA